MKQNFFTDIIVIVMYYKLYSKDFIKILSIKKNINAHNYDAYNVACYTKVLSLVLL